MLSKFIHHAKYALLFAPFLLFCIPLPISSDTKTSSATLLVFGILYALFFVHFLGKRSFSFLNKLPNFSLLFIVTCICILLAIQAFYLQFLSLKLLILISLSLIFLWGLLSKTPHPAKGLFALIIGLGVISTAEALLLAIPSSYLEKSITHTNFLVPPIDRGVEIYRKNGFRGKSPCKDCPDEEIKIFTIGGSSTFGLPLYYSYYTYSSVLQRLLNEGRPNEKYEVLNAGIAGYGIVQVLDSIKTELLKHKPDIIMICSWFNDSAKNMNWYGMTGKSDIEAYKMHLFLRWLQDFPPYKLISNSRLYKLYSYYLLKIQPYVLQKSKGQKIKPRTRTNTDEFKLVLEEINELSKKHNFLPIFITEALNRTKGFHPSLKKNKYYRTIVNTAETLQIPVIDTLTPLFKNKDKWLFYDFIHPNERGHEVIADAIFDQLFAQETQTKRSLKFWKKNKVSLQQAKVKRSPIIQITKENALNDLYNVNLSLPYLSNYQAKLSARFNGEVIYETIIDKDKTRSISISLKGKKLLPLNDLSFKASVSTAGNKKFLINNTGVYSPVYIKALSGGKEHGWRSEVHIQGLNASPNQRGYNIVVIGSQSGSVLSSAHFDIFGNLDANQKLAKYIASLSNFSENNLAPIVLVSVKTDGFHNADPEILSKAFRSIGGTGYTPQAFESFMLIGVPGSTPGSAYEEHAYKLIETEIGDKNIVKASLIEIE